LNNISYKKWQTIIRLPSLILLAFFIDQRGHLHKAQIESVIQCLGTICKSESHGLFGQIAADALEEFPAQIKSYSEIDVSSLTSYCAISIEDARSTMSSETFKKYIALMNDLAIKIRDAIPWYTRVQRIAFSTHSKKCQKYAGMVFDYTNGTYMESR